MKNPEDTRPRVATTKRIDLFALDQALGGHGLCAGENVVVVVEGSPVTEAQLRAAIEAHTAPPAPPTRGERIEAARAKVAAAPAGPIKEALTAVLDAIGSGR